MEEHGGNRQAIDDTRPLTLREYMLGEECIDALGILDSDLNIIQLSKRWMSCWDATRRILKTSLFESLSIPWTSQG